MNRAFGASILAYWQGNLEAKHTIERNDGYKEEIAVEYLFKKPSEWSKEEIQALDRIPPNSTILDVKFLYRYINTILTVPFIIDIF